MTEAEQAAARYASALAAIVAVLGPDHICSCEFPPDCGLPDEVEEALKIAKGALAGRSEMDEQIDPEAMAVAKAEHAELQRRFGVHVIAVTPEAGGEG